MNQNAETRGQRGHAPPKVPRPASPRQPLRGNSGVEWGGLGRRGARPPCVTLQAVLASLAEGATREEILSDFPTLDEEALYAVVAYAESAREDLSRPGVPRLP